MKTKSCNNPGLALPVTMIFSLCLQTSANHTYPQGREETWSPISQNLSGSHNRTEANTNSPLSINFSSEITTFEMQSTLQSFSSTTARNPTSSPATSAVSATGGPRNTSTPRSPVTRETCEDNKSLIVICFIIIAVLVLICTFLFLSTVVIANKLSYLKRTQQGKRRPRSNGDIVATSSLWPTAAGTWQRVPREPAGTQLIMQDLLGGRDTRNRRKTEGETDNAQENKDTSQSHKPILTNFVVEI
ncbi:protein EVI2A [Empidonax traillii]|uniref:protein EVI2A n=1 Tax=Empidonax traillii TaxID=164674 RepID=UPI000FFD7096|nr:protein EVI2A [Empidonax traillii]